MTETIYLLTICLPLATLLIIFGMRYLALAQQAKARFANDEGHRRLAEQSAATQAQAATALTSIDASLADVKARLAAIEKILKAVE